MICGLASAPCSLRWAKCGGTRWAPCKWLRTNLPALMCKQPHSKIEVNRSRHREPGRMLITCIMQYTCLGESALVTVSPPFIPGFSFNLSDICIRVTRPPRTFVPSSAWGCEKTTAAPSNSTSANCFQTQPLYTGDTISSSVFTVLTQHSLPKPCSNPKRTHSYILHFMDGLIYRYWFLWTHMHRAQCLLMSYVLGFDRYWRCPQSKFIDMELRTIPTCFIREPA